MTAGAGVVATERVNLVKPQQAPEVGELGIQCTALAPGFVDTPMTEFVKEQVKAEEMIRQLVDGQEAVARTARAVFPSAEKASDEPTADLLTQRLQIHEKTAWMLRSLLSK